ncbi:hypothetical protein LINPERHAP2_LOCUS13957 [Linum perenne]
MYPSTNSQPKILPFAILVILSTISSSSAFHWPWDPPTYTVHIINGLTGTKPLYAHCRCTHNYQPKTYVDHGAEYDLTFKSHVLKPTRWECYLAPDSIRRNYIIVYDDHTKTYDNNVYWVAKEDGIYNRDPQGTDTFTYEWLQKNITIMSQRKFFPPTILTLLVAAIILLAAIPQSSARHFRWGPPYHVQIVNQLSGHKLLYVHCSCTHKDKRSSFVKPRAKYVWRSSCSGQSSQCYLAPDNHRHVDFVAYDRNLVMHDHNAYWIAKEDGIYLRVAGGRNELKYGWSSGTVV